MSKKIVFLCLFFFFFFNEIDTERKKISLERKRNSVLTCLLYTLIINRRKINQQDFIMILLSIQIFPVSDWLKEAR